MSSGKNGRESRVAHEPFLDPGKKFQNVSLMQSDSRIYVAGHRGLVGSAIWRELERQGFKQLIGRTHKELALMDASVVDRFYREEQPEYVFVAAAKVGGILANNEQPADFLFQSLQIQNNLIHGAYRGGVKKCCSWQFLHLSKTRSATAQRRISAHRPS